MKAITVAQNAAQPNAVQISIQQCLELLGDAEQIHTFDAHARSFAGCDVERFDLIEDIVENNGATLVGNDHRMSLMGHAMLVRRAKKGDVFAEVDAKMAQRIFAAGHITMTSPFLASTARTTIRSRTQMDEHCNRRATSG